jgi:5-methylcytosine-specific restriction protein B
MSEKRILWIVGATYDSGDQYDRFMNDGIWENGYTDKHLDLVRSIQAGDRIAIKSAYVRKHELPFDNKGHSVSVLAIKAVGTVTENTGDGRVLKVDWVPEDKPREWYFYTYRATIWKVTPENWEKENLISFVLDGTSQDIGRFRNAPYWRERFGDVKEDSRQFKWTKFYEEMANKLLEFKSRREELVKGLYEMAFELDCLNNLNDQFSDGSRGQLKDICPFTFMGVFNRGITDANRKKIAAKLTAFLKITEPVPDTFESIPLLNNQRSWFFGYERVRRPQDIDLLWEMFEVALNMADDDEGAFEDAFVSAYNNVSECKGVGWNLTMGLYWIRPWFYPTLEGQSREYIQQELKIKVGNHGVGKRCDANEYLNLKEYLEDQFKDDNYPVHSFPELSQAAWNKNCSTVSLEDDVVEEEQSDTCAYKPVNRILYGPPGTGKTYNTVNHALALCEGQILDSYRDERREALQKRFQALQKSGQVSFVTFHQSMSYEDFVEGIKPQTADDGVSYSVTPGLFLELCERARDNWENSQKKESRSFDGLWEAFTNPLQQGEVDSLEVKTKRGAFSIYEVSERTVYFEKQNGSRTHTLSVKTLKRLYQNPEQVMALGGLQTYYRGVLEALRKAPATDRPKEQLKPFVLIVDEINRGNVSAILGELITLLEPDKRLGAENELRVTLPYSQDPDFGVPPNLHVIATMNTADRSVEALDTALRRRFTFEEMMPDSALLATEKFGVKLEEDVQSIEFDKMLNAINLRLEVLVGRDHTIGHAFFMRVKTLGDLKQVFHSKVIPQLQEYFYGDWEKIQWVLGEKFVSRETQVGNVSWPKVTNRPDETDGRDLWRITKSEASGEWPGWNVEVFQSIYTSSAG